MSIIKMVLDGNWSALKEHCDKTVAEKIAGRLEEKKMIVRARINGVSIDEMANIISAAQPITEAKEEKTFKSFASWKRAVKALEPDVKIEGDKDIASAVGKYKSFSTAEWDGETGCIVLKKTKE